MIKIKKIKTEIERNNNSNNSFNNETSLFIKLPHEIFHYLLSFLNRKKDDIKNFYSVSKEIRENFNIEFRDYLFFKIDSSNANLNDLKNNRYTHIIINNNTNEEVLDSLYKYEYIKSIKTEDTFENTFSFPPYLETLIFGAKFDKIIWNYPDNLTTLEFGSCWNGFFYKFPKKLISLKFGHDFNLPIYKFSKSLTNLEFGHNFNRPICKFPNSLTNLKYGYSFNRHIDDLPSSLIQLEIGKCFDTEIHKIPQNLKKLILYSKTQLNLLSSDLNLCDVDVIIRH